jgi:hypothetical protein
LLADHNINLPLAVDNWAVEYNGKLLKEIKREFEQKNRAALFVVVLFPGFDNSILRYALIHEGVVTLDYSQMNFSPYCKVGCVLNAYDGHPSAEFNEIFATQIYSDLVHSPVTKDFLEK